MTNVLIPATSHNDGPGVAIFLEVDEQLAERSRRGLPQHSPIIPARSKSGSISTCRGSARAAIGKRSSAVRSMRSYSGIVGSNPH
jgi:hypothetical protein